MVHDDLPYRAMRELAGVVCEEVNEKLRERDARLDRLEATVSSEARYADLEHNALYLVAAEVLTSGDQELFWQWAQEQRLPRPIVLRMVERWNRG